ncbi:MAG: hypothetical protein U0229_00670 [Anaeromyxobacter sp.]
MRLAYLFAAAAIAAAGCAAPSYVGQTGRVTPRHGFRGSVGAGYQLSTGAASVVKDGRDLAKTLNDKRRGCPDLSAAACWDAADVEPVVDAAYRFALAAPLSASTEVGLRYGFASGFDAGLRWGPAVKGLDVGWQLHGPRDASDGWAGTLLLGWSSRKLGALGTAIEDVFQGDASLTDYTLTYVTGWEYREIAHVYLGGRFIASRWKAQIVPDIPIVYDGGEIQAKFLGTDASGGLKHWGGFGGVALGYKRVWIGAELSLLWTSGSARIMFEDRSVSGLGVMPSVFLYAQ